MGRFLFFFPEADAIPNNISGQLWVQGAGVSCSHLWGRLFGSMQLSQKDGCIFSPGRWVL